MAIARVLTGFRLFAGEKLNEIINTLNSVAGGTGRLNPTAAGSTIRGAQFVGNLLVTATLVGGAAAGTVTLPTGAVVTDVFLETPVTIPGTPTNTNLRIGSSANGQQYVADVDVKTQGWIGSTLLYPGRNPVGVINYTIASTGGTAASQVGNILLHFEYIVP